MMQKYLQLLSVGYLAFLLRMTVLEVTEKSQNNFEVYSNIWRQDNISIKM